MHRHIDQTLITLATLLISGTGLFAVLTKFNVPELSMSFWGQNPFVTKRDVIDGVMTWIFTSLAIAGLLLQACALIWGNSILERQHSPQVYGLMFCVGLLMMVIVAFSLTKAGHFVARRRWLPEVLAGQKDLYDEARFILDHDGWRENQLEQKKNLGDSTKDIQANLCKVGKSLTQIESLLDLPRDGTDQRERLKRLRPYFEQ